MIKVALRNPHFRLFAGAFLISFSPVFVRLVSVSATTSAFYRCLFGGLALLIYLIIARRRVGPFGIGAMLVGAAVFFALDLWFWHRSILLIGPGLSTLLANLQVFFMIGAGILLLRERPSLTQWLAAPLAFAGLVMIFGRDWFALDEGFRRGVVLGILTALSYAGYLLCMRRARRGAADPLPAREVATVSLLAAALLGSAALLDGSSLLIPTTADLGWLLVYGAVAHACGLMFIASSLTEVAAAEVGIALLLQPALSMVWDVLLFARVLSLAEALGVGVTLCAIFLGSQRRAS